MDPDALAHIERSVIDDVATLTDSGYSLSTLFELLMRGYEKGGPTTFPWSFMRMHDCGHLALAR